MEEGLDSIEDGKKNWVKSLEKFYQAFDKELSTAKEGMKSLKKEEVLTDIVCDKCGEKMILRWGKHGEYIVCSGRPKCKNKKNVKVDATGGIEVVETEIKGKCPKCTGNLIEKRGRFGRFLACTNYPDCKYTEAYTLGFSCPVEGCTGKLVEKVSKKKKRFISCSRYPDCTFATNAEPVGGPCPACGSPTLFSYKRKPFCLRKDCGWKSE
jgi:DNA topoisomerase-1